MMIQDSWFSFSFAFVAAAALLYLPGLYFAYLLNIRKFFRLAVAPILSIGFVANLGVLFGALGISWSISKLIFAVFVLSGFFSLLKYFYGFVFKSETNQKAFTNKANKKSTKSIGAIFSRFSGRFSRKENVGVAVESKVSSKVGSQNTLKEKLDARRSKILGSKSFTQNFDGSNKTFDSSRFDSTSFDSKQNLGSVFEEKILTKNLVTWHEIKFTLMFALLSGFVMFMRSMWALGKPNAVSQSPDGHYHYNSVANMLDTGNVSSLNMLQLPPNESFYPAAWHDFVVSVIHVTGVQIPTAANAFTYLLLCFVWPVSMLAFATCVSRNKVFLILVGVFVNCYAYFPLLYLHAGILYANIVAASILPVILLVVVAFFFRLKYFSFTQTVVVGLFSLAALGFSQPNSIFIVYYVVLFVLPFAGWYLGKDLDLKKPNLDRWKDKFFPALGEKSTDFRAVNTIGETSGTNELNDGSVDPKICVYKNRLTFGVLGVLFAVLLAVTVAFLSYKIPSLHTARFTPDILTPLRHGRFEAILAFLTGAIDLARNNDVSIYYINFPVYVLSLVGIIVSVFRRKYLWIVVLSLWFAFVSFIAGSWSEPYFRAFISGVFYGEPTRLLPVQAVFVVVFTALGIKFVLGKVGLLFKDNDRVSVGFKKISVVVLIVLFAGYHFTLPQNKGFASFANAFNLPDTNDEVAQFFSKVEFDFMEKSGEKIQAGYTVAGNPFSGATASWFMFGQKNLFYHRASSQEEGILLIRDRLNMAKEDTKVCEAVREYKLRYVYEFGGQCPFNNICEKSFGGLKNLEQKGMGKLINRDEHGNKLIEITACW